MNIFLTVLSLRRHHNLHSKSYYYKIRDTKFLTPYSRAAKFIYLNRTCWNGLYRVNLKGEFNVPFGNYKNPKILDEHNILAVSKALQRDDLTSVDFEQAIKSAKAGDFLYLDPPYQPLSKTSSFTSYTKENFGLEDQERLAKAFRELHNKGCLVMLSNSHSQPILKLYKDFSSNIQPVLATRMINCKAEGRGKIKEVIITSYRCYAPLNVAF